MSSICRRIRSVYRAVARMSSGLVVEESSRLCLRPAWRSFQSAAETIGRSCHQVPRMVAVRSPSSVL